MIYYIGKIIFPKFHHRVQLHSTEVQREATQYLETVTKFSTAKLKKLSKRRFFNRVCHDYLNSGAFAEFAASDETLRENLERYHRYAEIMEAYLA